MPITRKEESCGSSLTTNAKRRLPIPSDDGPCVKRSGESSEERERDADCSHETVSPSASAERGQPPPPDRAAQRGAAPQTDPHLSPRWLWENHARQRMGQGNRATDRLALPGRRGERPYPLSDVPRRGCA